MDQAMEGTIGGEDLGRGGRVRGRTTELPGGGVGGFGGWGGEGGIGRGREGTSEGRAAAACAAMIACCKRQ